MRLVHTKGPLAAKKGPPCSQGPLAVFTVAKMVFARESIGGSHGPTPFWFQTRAGRRQGRSKPACPRSGTGV